MGIRSKASFSGAVGRIVIVIGLAAMGCGRIGYQLEEEVDYASSDGSHPGTAGAGGAGGAGAGGRGAGGGVAGDGGAGGGAGTSLPDSDAGDARAGSGGGDATLPDAVAEARGADAPDAGAQDARGDASIETGSADGGSPDAPREAAIESGSGPMTIDDSVAGTALNQFNYVGANWLHCTACIIGATYYDMSDSWSNVTGEYVTFTFVGTQLKFYGVLDTVHGIGAASIDSGPETMIDFYTNGRLGDQLLWTSPVLANGLHTFALRVTGQKNRKSSDFFVTVDRVDVQ